MVEMLLRELDRHPGFRTVSPAEQCLGLAPPGPAQCRVLPGAQIGGDRSTLAPPRRQHPTAGATPHLCSGPAN